MYAQVFKSKENKGRPVCNSVVQMKRYMGQRFGFADNKRCNIAFKNQSAGK